MDSFLGWENRGHAPLVRKFEYVEKLPTEGSIYHNKRKFRPADTLSWQQKLAIDHN